MCNKNNYINDLYLRQNYINGPDVIMRLDKLSFGKRTLHKWCRKYKIDKHVATCEHLH